ncbi:hypothetical protein ACLB2K_004424 [Fragaria x ananassa]
MRAVSGRGITQEIWTGAAAKGNASWVEEDWEKASQLKPSLLVKASQLKRDAPEIIQTEQLVQQEKEMIEHLSDRKTLMSVRELA